ncbi:MAG TPA: hypothetical protein VHG91_14700 [Longimicrobium sp.]|nr:hypothetical protein [Longimicrobium sp.]
MRLSDVFGIGMLVAFVAGLVALIRPRLVGMKSRGGGCALFGVLCFGLMLATGSAYEKEQESEIPDTPSDEFPVLPGSGADPDANPIPGGIADTGTVGGDSAAAAGPEGGHFLQADTGQIRIYAGRERTERAYLIAELPRGTEVTLIERQNTPIGERCNVRTTFPPIVSGWVRCAEVSP